MDVEQLRRQAKEFVRAVRAGDRDALTRLGDLSPRLASAHLVIAREHGYTSWPALVHGGERRDYVEELRRQAKEFVRAARAGDRDALARLGGLSPQFASAQLVIAREHGYTSWPALVHGGERRDYDALVGELGSGRERWQAQAAWERLMEVGNSASDAVRAGLSHPDPKVRVGCLGFMDHHLDEASLPAVFANLEHYDGRVRAMALHVLACDNCKDGDCRPRDQDVIPIALRFLQHDRSRKVRTGAAMFLGRFAPERSDVARALEHARDHDPHPVVRKVARWNAPGGGSYLKCAAKLVQPNPQ